MSGRLSKLIASLGRSTGLVLAVVAMAVVLTGCDAVREWEEEVKLHDGRIIVVKRTEVDKRTIIDWQNPGGILKEARIRVADSVSVEWRGDMYPIALDESGANVIVVIALGGGGQCMLYGNPNPPFVYFRSRKGGPWERVNPSDVPPGMHQNLWMHPRKSEIEKLRGPLKAKGKEKLNIGVSRETLEFSPTDTRRQQLC